MADPIMYQVDGYVVLRHDHPEQLMEPDEIRTFFETLLSIQPDLLPADLAKLPSQAEQIDQLLADYCELEIEDGFLQWYAVRFEK
ncbi:chlororespiratory reduction protein 7 [Synechococcus sp. BDU 130192]|uniref:chlororespiratory reduction protein 7 n=1 Tax=Synechococcus sp. BDU 130192 TaxID=2042059 RepID=UPI000C071F28|nr:chlororespiratory reduction protein 7 [Synechococcus sp. BDU 130192]